METAAKMSENNHGAELTDLIARLRTVATEAREAFGQHTPQQLNWKPAADSWSIAQCFEHLSKTNELYFPVLEEIVAGRRRSSFLEKYSPLSGFWGKFLVKAIQPESARKLKTTQKFQPSASDIDAGVIEKFGDEQERLIGLIEATRNLDLRRVIITSPFNSLVTYNLLDAYRAVLAHERRHLAQARRVTEAEGFPSAAGTSSVEG